MGVVLVGSILRNSIRVGGDVFNFSLIGLMRSNLFNKRNRFNGFDKQDVTTRKWLRLGLDTPKI